MTPIDTPDGMPPSPPRKRTLIVAVAIGAAALLALSTALLITGRGHKVRYELETSSGSARLIGWSNGNGDLERTPDSPDEQATTPWSATETFTRSGERASIAADTDSGTATCRLFIDGTLVDEFHGDNGALCEATIP